MGFNPAVFGKRVINAHSLEESLHRAERRREGVERAFSPIAEINPEDETPETQIKQAESAVEKVREAYRDAVSHLTAYFKENAPAVSVAVSSPSETTYEARLSIGGSEHLEEPAIVAAQVIYFSTLFDLDRINNLAAHGCLMDDMTRAAVAERCELKVNLAGPQTGRNSLFLAKEDDRLFVARYSPHDPLDKGDYRTLLRIFETLKEKTALNVNYTHQL